MSFTDTNATISSDYRNFMFWFLCL